MTKEETIKREDVIFTVLACSRISNLSDEEKWDKCVNLINRLPSAEAEPTIIRSRTLLPTKDFEEWAKRIKEVNPNAVVIPCDAEVASADTVQGEWKIDEYGIYHCPFCHAINNTVYKSFCPNCGAKMKRSKKE